MQTRNRSLAGIIRAFRQQVGNCASQRSRRDESGNVTGVRGEGRYLLAHLNRLAEHLQIEERGIHPLFPGLSLPPNPTLAFLSVPSTMPSLLERQECQPMSPPPLPP